ncbi:hypothetical protein [Hypericibacter sp.]|uniref:hypothetical protein n=1 Tax=Hypericibacter sp. TaxID=2705401 RepID=UPI003D6D50D3
MNAAVRIGRYAAVMALLVAGASGPMAQASEQEDHRIGITPAAQDPASVPITVGEVEAMRQQLMQCWTLPKELWGRPDLMVTIHATYNADGSLAHAEIVDRSRMESDPYYRTAALRAYNAVELCSPLQQMPAAKYEQWKNVTLKFDPKEMVGQ